MTDDYTYEEYEDDVDLDPTNKPPSNRIERFKGETGKVYRVALLYFHPLTTTIQKALKKKADKDGVALDMVNVKNTISMALTKRAADLGKNLADLQDYEKLDLNSAQFKKYTSHYHVDVGIVLSRLGKDGPEADKIWKSLPEPRTYYSTVALFYPVDSSGNVDAKNILRDAHLKPWRFSNGLFRTLHSKNEMLQEYNQSLANNDLKLNCKSAQFQNFEIDPAGPALWLKSPALKAKFLPMAHELYGKLVDAREMSTAEVRDKLNLASGEGDSGSDVVEGDDMADLLKNV